MGPPEPTHFDSFGADVLDICIIKNIKYNVRVNNTCELNSDHTPILIQMGNELNIFPDDTINSIDWQKYPEILKENQVPVPKIFSTEDVDKAIDKLENIIQQSILKSSSVRTKPKYMYSLPDSIKQKIRDKNRAKRIAHRTMDPLDKRNYNQLKMKSLNS